MGILWDFVKLKTHYFKKYRVQGNGYFSSRTVQGCIHAKLTNGNICCKEYSPYVNSMVYTIG